MVRLNDEEAIFASVHDAGMLLSVIEGSNFYHFGTKVKTWVTADLKSFILMFAVKAQGMETITRLLGGLPPTAHIGSTPLESRSSLASNLAQEQARGAFNEALCPQNKRRRERIPLLQWAIECNHVNLAALLIAKEFIETSGDSWRQMTPLGLAFRCGHEDIARQLLKDVRTKQPDGQWPLHPAATYGHTKIVRLLPYNGAEIDTRDHDRRTALNHAARRGHVEIVKILIDIGADLESKSKFDSKTPLHEGCDTKQEAVISILAE